MALLTEKYINMHKKDVAGKFGGWGWQRKSWTSFKTWMAYIKSNVLNHIKLKRLSRYGKNNQQLPFGRWWWLRVQVRLIVDYPHHPTCIMQVFAVACQPTMPIDTYDQQIKSKHETRAPNCCSWLFAFVPNKMQHTRITAEASRSCL
jgi:hypothetical protein